MAISQAILQSLKASKNLAVEPAVAMALPHAPPAEQDALADVLIERNHRAGWVALIRSFDQLHEGLQRRILDRPRDLFAPLADTMDDPTGNARGNVIRIVRQVADTKLIYLLAEALMDARPEVRELAGTTMLDAIRRFCAEAKPREDVTPEQLSKDQQQIRRATEFALRHFKSHRQQAALTAVLMSERQQDSRMWAAFQDVYDEASRAGTILLRQLAEPGLARAAYLALGSPLKAAAMAGISSAEKPAVEQALAAESFRLVDPMLRDAAATVGHVKALNSPRRESPWSQETWPGWLRLLETVGLPANMKVLWLTRMLEDARGNVAWRVSVARVLGQMKLHESNIALVPLLGDPDVRVARIAARYLSNRNMPEWRSNMGHIAASPHASVRKFAGQAAGHTQQFDKLWQDYQKLPPAMQVSSTRSTAVSEADFAEQLRQKLGSQQMLDLAQGLKMLGSLKPAQMGPFRNQVIALCAHGDARVASLAVRLVGRLEDPRMKDLLEAAAQHADARVRANAIEAMDNLHIAHQSRQVLAMINSRHNRERANAIKAMLQYDYATARDCLNKMLADPNPMHRVSALWVIEQLDLLALLRQVHSMARRDPNTRVRHRAEELLATVVGTMPTGQAG